MVLSHLSKYLLVLLLCTSVDCKFFYMMENMELVDEKKIKSGVIISKPTDCLRECLLTAGCESFNVFHNFPGRLMCSLYTVSHGTLASSPHVIHFTTNKSNKPVTPTTSPNGITSSNEKSFILEKNIQGTLHCLGSSLKWKVNIPSQCQILKVINGETLIMIPNEKCFGLHATSVELTQPPSCGNLRYNDNTKQFQYNADIHKCIEFKNSSKPLVHACDIKRGNYTKKIIP